MSAYIEYGLAELTDKAYRLLRRREHSVKELTVKLGRFAPEDLVKQVVAELQNQGEQSDLRFAEMLCRSRVNTGKGPLRIQRELAEHAIPAEIVSNTLQAYAGMWLGLADEVIEKKFGTDSPASYQEWCRRAKFLQLRGFSTDNIGSFDK